MKFPLIYQPQLNSKEFDACWPNQRVADGMHSLSYYTQWVSQPFKVPHRGVDNFPLSRDPYLNVLKEYGGIEIVDTIDQDFSMTWSEVTDTVAIDLLERSRRTQKPIMLAWSGGIDSTTVLAALLKWANKEDDQRIIVVTNKAAIWESGKIFYEHVIPRKIKVLDYDKYARTYSPEELKNHIYVTGQVADQLVITLAQSTELALTDPSYFTKPWKDTKNLFDYWRTYLRDEEKIWWLINSMAENIESTGLPLNSIWDFLWWYNFNYYPAGVYLNDWSHIWFHINERCGVVDYLENTHQWFLDAKYQKWAFNTIGNRELVFGPKLNQWKWCMKQYICDFTKDPWWLEYKTKLSSVSRFVHGAGKDSMWVAIANKENNFRQLTKANDLELLQASLAENINPNF